MRTSVSRVTINASLAAVWAALTEPRYVERWQYGSQLETDWTVESPLRFTTEWEGQLFEQWGTVLTFDEPTTVRYSLFAPRPGLADVPENYFTMTYELERDADTTWVTITQDDPRAEDGERPDEDDATNPVLLALKDVAESIRGD
jgi:uncharacterized protein YndB with AHSA1/START domain